MKKETLVKFYSVYKLYIFPSAIALSSLFLIIFAIYPQAVKLIENQKLAGDSINRTQFLATKVQALEGYDEEDLSQKVNIVLDSFPSDKEYGRVLGLLQGLAAQSGFIVSSISFGNASGKTGAANSFGVNLEVSGPKALFRALLSSLDNSPRIVRVSSLDILSARSADVLNVKLAIEVLYSPIPQNLGTIDSPLPNISSEEEGLIAALKTTTLPASASAATTSPRGKVNPFE